MGHVSRLLWPKSTVYEHLSMRDGKRWLASCCKLQRALKKSASEGLGRNPADRERSGGKIHLHMDGRGIPFGVTVAGANVHDSRLIGASLKNSRKMGGCFLGADVCRLCLGRGYDYSRVSEEVYIHGFEEHIRSRRKELYKGQSGTDICLAEDFSEPAHALLLLPRQFYGATLPCFGLYPLEKTGIARCMPDILLIIDKRTFTFWC